MSFCFLLSVQDVASTRVSVNQTHRTVCYIKPSGKSLLETVQKMAGSQKKKKKSLMKHEASQGEFTISRYIVTPADLQGNP